MLSPKLTTVILGDRMGKKKLFLRVLGFKIQNLNFQKLVKSVEVYLTAETGQFRQLKWSTQMILAVESVSICQFKILMRQMFIQKHWVVISLEGYSLQYAWKLRVEGGWSRASLHMSNARNYKEQLIRKGDHANLACSICFQTAKL